MRAIVHTESGSIYRFYDNDAGEQCCIREGAHPCRYLHVAPVVVPVIGQRMSFRGMLDSEPPTLRFTRTTPVVEIEQ